MIQRIHLRRARLRGQAVQPLVAGGSWPSLQQRQILAWLLTPWQIRSRELGPEAEVVITHLGLSQCQSSHNSSQTVALLLEDQGFRHSCLWDLFHIKSIVWVISLLYISCEYVRACVSACACLCTCAQECQKRILDVLELESQPFAEYLTYYMEAGI